MVACEYDPHSHTIWPKSPDYVMEALQRLSDA